MRGLSYVGCDIWLMRGVCMLLLNCSQFCRAEMHRAKMTKMCRILALPPTPNECSRWEQMCSRSGCSQWVAGRRINMLKSFSLLRRSKLNLKPIPETDTEPKLTPKYRVRITRNIGITRNLKLNFNPSFNPHPNSLLVSDLSFS